MSRFCLIFIAMHIGCGCFAQKTFATSDPKIAYAEQNSFHLAVQQVGLLQDTLQLPNGKMVASPDVIRMNMLLMKSLNAKRVLDVGLFTGSSALAAALVVPTDGVVISMDVNRTYWDNVGKRYADWAGVTSKIDTRFHPENAGNIVLDELVQSGQDGTFDFCFIDADKEPYLDYYLKCRRLLRSGGIIAIDNVMWGENPVNSAAAAINRMNQFISTDTRVMATMLPIAQGLTIVYKL